MRLIDADALIAELDDERIADTGDGFENIWNAFNVGLAKAKLKIETAPTIDPLKEKSLDQLMDECLNRGYRKAVRHGKWEYAEDEVLDDLTFSAWKCSCCGYYAYKPELWHYCPRCGAKMEVEHEVD